MFHYLPLLNFATVFVTLNPHETASTMSGRYESYVYILCIIVVFQRSPERATYF